MSPLNDKQNITYFTGFLWNVVKNWGSFCLLSSNHRTNCPIKKSITNEVVLIMVSSVVRGFGVVVIEHDARGFQSGWAVSAIIEYRKPITRTESKGDESWDGEFPRWGYPIARFTVREIINSSDGQASTRSLLVDSVVWMARINRCFPLRTVISNSPLASRNASLCVERHGRPEPLKIGKLLSRQ